MLKEAPKVDPDRFSLDRGADTGSKISASLIHVLVSGEDMMERGGRYQVASASRICFVNVSIYFGIRVKRYK